MPDAPKSFLGNRWIKQGKIKKAFKKMQNDATLDLISK
jgi:hypothetical protein